MMHRQMMTGGSGVVGRNATLTASRREKAICRTRYVLMVVASDEAETRSLRCCWPWIAWRRIHHITCTLLYNLVTRCENKWKLLDFSMEWEEGFYLTISLKIGHRITLLYNLRYLNLKYFVLRVSSSSLKLYCFQQQKSSCIYMQYGFLHAS